MKRMLPLFFFLIFAQNIFAKSVFSSSINSGISISCLPTVEVSYPSDKFTPYLNYTAFAPGVGLTGRPEGININNYDLKYVKLTFHRDSFMAKNCYTDIVGIYRFTDLYDNFRDLPQTIIINDSIAPTISCPADVVFDEGIDKLEDLTGLAYAETERQILSANFAMLGITVTDNCLFDVTYTDTKTGICPVVITRTFVVLDTCGNKDECQQEIKLQQLTLTDFGPFGPYCLNTAPDVLPVISIDGIKGKWTPATIDTKTKGTANYTFTPDADQCATEVLIKVEITDEIIPIFSTISPFCLNSAAPALSLISENGITGTWNPAKIITNNPGIYTYKFTPDPGQCSAPVSMDIEISDEIIPLLGALDPYCLNSVAPDFPLVLENGITGTWIPSKIVTNTAGIFTYTFTPNPGQCSAPLSINIEISDKTPPEAICRNITLFLDEEGKASINTAQIDNGSSDNCQIDTLYLSRYDFDCDDVGANKVTLTAINDVGLMDTCISTITVLDTIKPVVKCKDYIEVQLYENSNYKLTVADVLEYSSDACGIDSLYVFARELDCDQIGLTTITLFADDVNKNNSYCRTIVLLKGNKPPIVINDSVTTFKNVQIVIDVLANDYVENTSMDISTMAITIKPLHGYISLNPINGNIIYTPDLNFSGLDILQYSICDDGIPCNPECGKAFVYINVKAINYNTPDAIDDYFSSNRNFTLIGNMLVNDSDSDGDNLQIETDPVKPPIHGLVNIDPDGTFTYSPNKDFIGIDSFQYIICDNGIPSLCDWATVFIDILTNVESKPFDDIDCNIFPNPGNGIFSIEIFGLLDTDIYVDILNSTGSVISKYHFEKTTGFFKQSINEQGLASGVYYIQFTAEDYQTTKKIIIN
jgi:hypothetical protein